MLARGRGCAPCPARCAQEGQPRLSTRWKPNSYEVPPQLRERPSLQRHLAGSGWCCSSPQLHAQRWILFRPLTPELGHEVARMSAGSVWRALCQPLSQWRSLECRWNIGAQADIPLILSISDALSVAMKAGSKLLLMTGLRAASGMHVLFAL